MQITLQIKKKKVSTLILFWQVICVHTNLIRPETVKKKSLSRYKVTKPHYDDILSNRLKLLWSILKVIFKTDLSYLLSLVFVSLSLVLSVYCFPDVTFCFYLHLNLWLAGEFTYCHIRNVIRLPLSDVNFLHVIVFVVLELALVLWYLSGCDCA